MFVFEPLFNTRVNVKMSSRVQFHIHAAIKVMLVHLSCLHLFGLRLFCKSSLKMFNVTVV